MLEEAISQNGVESTERIPISGGTYVEPYLPKYHLGIVLKNLRDCPAAVRAWAQSEQDGAIQQTGLYRSLQKERDTCGK